jgi:hypothetical protein
MSATPVIPDNVVAFYARGSMPRGVRNNNPGNIRLGDTWQGLCSVQTDKAFCQFSEIGYGMRCLGYILRNSYFHRQALTTPRKIISRWAPPNENDTESYIQAVCDATHVHDTDYIDLRKDGLLCDLMMAIVKHENGTQPYLAAQFVAGIRLI